MIIKTGFIGDITTFSRRVNRVEKVDGFVGIGSVREGAEIEEALIVGPPSDLQKGVVSLHRDVGIMGVIHHHDVVAGIVGLDQVHLEDESLLVGVDDDEVEMIDMGDHGEDLASLGTKKILAHPFLEVLGLADVDDLIVLVFHLINTRFIRQKGNKTF